MNWNLETDVEVVEVNGDVVVTLSPRLPFAASTWRAGQDGLSLFGDEGEVHLPLDRVSLDVLGNANELQVMEFREGESQPSREIICSPHL